jgi:hypothetical protein
MKPREIFGIAVRIVGLIAILIGLYYLATGAFLLFAADGRLRSYGSVIWVVPAGGIALLLVGIYFLRGAAAVIYFAYPHDDSDDKKNHDA